MVIQTATISVVEGPILPDDQLGAIISDPTDGRSMLPDYHIVNYYEKDKHTYMMGVASPGGFQGANAAFVKLTADTLILCCDWTALKSLSQPQIPDPTSQDPNWILLYESVEEPEIAVMADGITPIYRISGTYYYGKTNPDPTLVNDTNYPRPPFIADQFDRTQPQSSLTTNLRDINAGNNQRVLQGSNIGGQ